MRKFIPLLVMIVCALFGKAQDFSKYNPIKAEIKGGNQNLEQILQTQLSLPKNFFANGYEENVTIYFVIDSLNQPVVLSFQPHVLPAGQKELTRILRFMHFVRLDPDYNVPYYITVPLSAKNYYSLLKQKNRPLAKTGLKSDSSFVVYSKADRSPDYYKDGENGLKDFILSEIEYPKLAIEKSVEGTVVIEFVVETNGYVTNAMVKQPLGAGCSEEALRLITKTRWLPAQLNGKLVRYKMAYPITFSLLNKSRD